MAQLADTTREWAKRFMIVAPNLEDAYDVEVEKDIEELWDGMGQKPEADTRAGEVIEKPKSQKSMKQPAKTEPEVAPETPSETTGTLLQHEEVQDNTKGQGEAKEAQKSKRDPSTIKTFTELCRACHEDWPDTFKSSKDVLKELGVASRMDLKDLPADCYIQIAGARG